jgi:hypothetical protein
MDCDIEPDRRIWIVEKRAKRLFTVRTGFDVLIDHLSLVEQAIVMPDMFAGGHFPRFSDQRGNEAVEVLNFIRHKGYS